MNEEKRLSGRHPGGDHLRGAPRRARRRRRGRLPTIAGEAERAGVKAPAIIIIGGVVGLRGKLRWFDTLPLFGKKIVVTRTREQASVLTRRLAEQGADVIEFPTIRIRPKEDTRAIDEAISKIDSFDWIIFTSQNAVGHFLRQVQSLRQGRPRAR
jgi:uroporphyrinogen III methyltransferase/synthase